MKNQILSLALVMTGIFILVLTGCKPGPTTKNNCEKLIMENIKDGGIYGAAPVRIEGAEVTLPPPFNLDFYKITELNDVKVIEFGPVPSKEDMKNGNISGILDKMPMHCKHSIIHKFGTSHAEMKGYTAILAEVSIAEVMPNDSLGKMFKKRIKIHDEYLNQTTRVWFLGHTIAAEYKGEEDLYSVEVACFEDLEYFDNLIEILD